MKKIIICLVAVLFAAVTLSARPTGFNIGGGFTYIGLTNEASEIDAIGPYVEVGYDLKVAKNSYVYFGGRFSNGLHSYDVGSQYTGGNVASLRNRGELFIPIRFQQNFQINPNGTTFYIEAGPAAGVLLYDVTTVVAWNQGSGSAAKSQNNVNAWNLNRGNVYLGGNIGFNIKKHVKIYAGGDYGFINVFNSKTGAEANNWQLNLGACYVF